MPRAGRSSVWWLWSVGLLAFLLTARPAKPERQTTSLWHAAAAKSQTQARRPACVSA